VLLGMITFLPVTVSLGATYFIGTLYYNKEPGSKAQYHLLKCKGNAGPYQAQRDTIRMTFQSSFLKCLDIGIQ
jgi:hypothetical protein